MTNDFIEFWATEFPFGFEEFVKGLSNEKRLAIASLLLEKKSLRFSQIQQELELKKNILSQHLKIMLNYGLIHRTKTVWNEKEKVFKYFYELNPFYRKLIEMNKIQLIIPFTKSFEATTRIGRLKENYNVGIENIKSLKYETSAEEIPLKMVISDIKGGTVAWSRKPIKK